MNQDITPHEPQLPAIVGELRGHFTVLCTRALRPDLAEVAVDAARMAPILTWLKTATGYQQLTLMSAVDWLEDEEFQLTYLVTDPVVRHTLMLTTRIPRQPAVAESVHGLWDEAVTYEQELYEMFGIHFPGSPRQGENFILEDWPHGPPMRRDFDTLAFAEANYEFRPGRHSLDPKEVRAAFMAQEKAKKAVEKGGAS